MHYLIIIFMPQVVINLEAVFYDIFCSLAAKLCQKTQKNAQNVTFLALLRSFCLPV